MDVREVDQFFILEKKVTILGPWTADRPGSRRHERVAELLAEGRILQQQLVFTALSDLGTEKAKAQIFWGDGRLPIARLEMGNAGITHANQSPRPADLPAVVGCPHAHLWADNRQFLDRRHRPVRSGRELGHARLLPPTLKGWEEAVLWFLASCRISLPPTIRIGLPQRTTLL